MGYPTYRHLNDYAAGAAAANDHWWRDPATGEPVERNMGEMLMLVVSEIAEAMEADRKQLMDDKLPHRNGVEVELADALIRIFDIAGHLEFDLEGAYREKMEYNRTRYDHSKEARLASGGKRY
jgi:NTP pyrophosphatase (non-canonical NTP hydrolase)